MSFRGSIAGLVAIFLLAISSWSSACDLSCSLASHRAVCEMGKSQPQQAESASGSTMDLPICQHATSPASADLSTNAPAVTTAPCLHDACRQAATFTAAKRSSGHVRSNRAALRAAAIVQTAHLSALPHPTDHEYPPPKSDPSDGLSVNLRI